MDKVSPLNLIAKLAGVSKMTVSRAMREGTSVDPELRVKIREIARKLGYQPDSRISEVMRAVRKAQTSSYRETLAFIWTHRLADEEQHGPSFQEEFDGAMRRAQHLGYRLDVFRVQDEEHHGNSLSHILATRSIRGVLIAPPGPAEAAPGLELDWKQFSCVLLGAGFADLDLPRVQHDDYSGCVMALGNLERLQHRRIGLVLPRAMDELAARLVRSAFTSFHPLGPKEAEKLIFNDGKNEAKALKPWLAQTKAEVILARIEDDFPQLDQLRRQAPKGTLFAALNWDKSRPDVSGIDQHRAVIGEQALDLLLLRLQGEQTGLDPLAPSIKVPGSWRDSIVT